MDMETDLSGFREEEGEATFTPARTLIIRQSGDMQDAIAIIDTRQCARSRSVSFIRRLIIHLTLSKQFIQHEIPSRQNRAAMSALFQNLRLTNDPPHTNVVDVLSGVAIRPRRVGLQSTLFALLACL